MVEDEWSCELGTKPELAILWLHREKCAKSRCLDVVSKSHKQVMMMLRGGAAPSRLRVDGGEDSRERRGRVRSVSQGRWRMLPINYLSVMHATLSAQDMHMSMRHLVKDCDSSCTYEDDKLVLVWIRDAIICQYSRTS